MWQILDFLLYKNYCKKKGREQTWENKCEKTCNQVWLFLNAEQYSTGSQCNFFKNNSYILVYPLVFDAILATLFWIPSVVLS